MLLSAPPVKDESFPSAPQALLLVLALFMAEYLVGAALYDVRQALGLTREELSALVKLLGSGMLFAVLLHAKALPYRALFHPSRASLRATMVLLIPPVALLVPALVLLASELSDLLVRIFPLSAWEEQAFASMSAANIAAMTAVCVLAPVLEEMLFRGIILRAFMVQYSRGTAIAASALIFGVAHLNIYQFVIAFLLGLIAGWLYERSRSLVPSIALHAAYNTSLTVVGSSSWGGQAGSTQPASTTVWVLSLAAALVGALALNHLLAGSNQRVAT